MKTRFSDVLVPDFTVNQSDRRNEDIVDISLGPGLSLAVVSTKENKSRYTLPSWEIYETGEFISQTKKHPEFLRGYSGFSFYI
jgi:hypothetical protein